MSYKAVLADVDGTLISPGLFPPPVPSERLKKAVKECQKRGVVFGLATARSLMGIGELVEELDLQSPIILDNGALIYDCKGKRYLWKSLLPKKEAQKTIEYLREDKSLSVVVVDDGTRLTDFSEIAKWKISKIVVMDNTPEKAEEIYQYIKKNPFVHVTKSISKAQPLRLSIHITNTQATKQVAVLKLAKYLKIDTKEIIAIGDSSNDLPLFLACGLKVAMGNATADIKEIADVIAPTFEEDGVAWVIEKFILKIGVPLKSVIPSESASWRSSRGIFQLPERGRSLHSHKRVNRLWSVGMTNELHNLTGEKKDQLLITCDKKGNIIGQASREDCHKGKGKTHLAFMAFVQDTGGKIILTKRSKRKSLWGEFWDASVISHVLPEETVMEAAIRRGKEELGVKVDFKDLGAFYYNAKHGDSAENEYCHVLIGKTGLTVEPNPVEISEIKKLDFNQLTDELRKHPNAFTPWFKLSLEKFDLKKCL